MHRYAHCMQGALLLLLAGTLAATSAFLIARGVGRPIAQRIIDAEMGHAGQVSRMGAWAFLCYVYHQQCRPRRICGIRHALTSSGLRNPAPFLLHLSVSPQRFLSLLCSLEHSSKCSLEHSNKSSDLDSSHLRNIACPMSRCREGRPAALPKQWQRCRWEGWESCPADRPQMVS